MLISLNSNAIAALKYLFGLPDDKSGTESFPEENVKLIQKMYTVLSKIDLAHILEQLIMGPRLVFPMTWVAMA